MALTAVMKVLKTILQLFDDQKTAFETFEHSELLSLNGVVRVYIESVSNLAMTLPSQHVQLCAHDWRW